MHYILGAKLNDHKFLFDWVANSKTTEHEVIDKEGTVHHFSFVNSVPLNDASFDVPVNFLAYQETRTNGKVQRFSWVTDFEITADNAFQIMRGGRARWKIENETFNTLKNQGYNFEHNYGHGNEYLFTVLSMLMMLAFLIDQVQMLSSPLFQQARKAAGSWYALWEDMRALLKWVILENWEQLFEFVLDQKHGPPMKRGDLIAGSCLPL